MITQELLDALKAKCRHAVDGLILTSLIARTGIQALKAEGASLLLGEEG